MTEDGAGALDGTAQADARGLHRRPRAMAGIAGHVRDDQDARSDGSSARTGGHVGVAVGFADRREGVASFVARRRPRCAPLGALPH